jgi:hypothetical protein
MTDTSTAVSLAPVVDALQPYVTVAVTTIIGIAITYAMALLRQYANIHFNQSFVDAMTAEADKQASILVAKASDNLANQSVNAHTPVIAEAANYVAKNMPTILKNAGASTDDFAHTIAAAIGNKQIIMAAGTTAVPPVVADPKSRSSL